jgi:hypothetical protein
VHTTGEEGRERLVLLHPVIERVDRRIGRIASYVSLKNCLACQGKPNC